MTWNYRVFLIPGGSPLEEDIYAIKEVYYGDDDEIEFWSEANMAPMGNTIEELEEDLEKFIAAFDEPVLLIDGDRVIEIGEIVMDEELDEPIIDVDLQDYH
jgi:hypothetical protein